MFSSQWLMGFQVRGFVGLGLLGLLFRIGVRMAPDVAAQPRGWPTSRPGGGKKHQGLAERVGFFMCNPKS